MNEILFAILLLVVLGLLSGLILAVVSVLMVVPKDEKEDELRALLPGANCGACGFSGCDGYAKALASGKAKPGLCSAGGARVAEALASCLGVAAEEPGPRVAMVRCLGSNDNTVRQAGYEGIQTCAAAMLVSGGPENCVYGCIGLGDCVSACRFNALSIRNGVAMVSETGCVGCGMCVKACPKQLITLIPVKRQAAVLCSSCDKGGSVSKICHVGCIGCMKCEKTCPYDAMHMKSFLASVDPEKCTGCGKCADVCPRHIIVMKG